MPKLGFLASVGLSLTIFNSVSSGAAAEPTPAPLPMPAPRLPDPKPAEVTKSYAWQFVLPTIAFDIVSLSGIMTTNRKYGPVLVLAGWGGRSISGPIAHFAHRRVWAGLGSLALEGLSPVVGAATGFLFAMATCDREPNDYCYIDYERDMAIMGPLFAVAGTIADAALLANEPMKPEPGKETGFSWAPYVTPTVFPGARKGELGSAWSFGVAGRF